VTNSHKDAPFKENLQPLNRVCATVQWQTLARLQR